MCPHLFQFRQYRTVGKHRGIQSALAAERNRRILEREDVAAALVIHAAPGGETEALCREIAALRPGLPRLTLDDPENANLVALGFAAVGVDEAGRACLPPA
jgi:hypothetical protein